MSNTHKPSLADLRFQLFLYYNALFSIFFSIIIMSCSIQKAQYYNKFVSISVAVTWTVVEPFRIYFGFLGNLHEQVSPLATFFFLSLFPQLPFIVYLAYYQPVLFPADFIMGSFMLVFLAFELVIGLFVGRRQIRAQTTQLMRQLQSQPVSSSSGGGGGGGRTATGYERLNTHDD